jgi:hypothetical protein
MSVFEEEDLLPASLTSIRDFVDNVLIIDGSYPDWPSDHALSEDETKEIAHRIAGDKLIWMETKTQLFESAKLDMALDRIEQEPDGQDLWVFLQSADEVFSGDYVGELDELRASSPSECRVAQIKFHLPAPHRTQYMMPRFFRLSGGGVRHGRIPVSNCMYPQKVLEAPWYPGRKLEKCWLLHLKDGRNLNRQRERDSWYASGGLKKVVSV